MGNSEKNLIRELVFGEDNDIPEFFEIENNLADAMFEAVHIMRWTESKQSMYTALKDSECQQICIDLIKKLDKAGYKIVKK